MLPVAAQVIAMVAFAILRLLDLSAAQFWYDESFTVTLARLPLDRMILATAGDTHPPLYYLVVWPWVHIFGPVEWAARFPSVIFGLLGIVLLWKICQELKVPTAAAVVGVLFMGIAPVQLHFSQEARMYTLFTALVLWMVLATLRRRWIWVSVAAVLALYTHNYAVFYVIAVGLLALIREMKRPYFVDPDADDPYNLGHVKADQAQFTAIIKAFFIPLVLYIPWIIVLLFQMSQVAAGYWIQPITNGGVVYSLYMLFWGFAMPEAWQPVAVIITSGLLVYAMTRPQDKTLVLIGLVPLVLALIASLVWKPILLFRGLLPSAPFLYVLVAGAVFSAKPAWKRLYAAGVLAPVIVAGIWGYYRYNPTNKGDTLGVINQVRQQWQPGDLIYHVNDGSVLSWGIYAANLPQIEMDPCPQANPGGLSAITRQAIGIQQSSMNQIHGRVWVVWSAGPTSTDCEVYRASQWTNGQPVTLIRDDQYVLSGVWLWRQ